jgi:ubiquinone/menaquinone biosynthesis C-methylase UbiE
METTMTEVPRNETYYAADTDETIGRLIRNAEWQAQNVRDGFHRTDVGPGSKVIEVGCGPLGALRELSELVAPRGSVVGLDMDQGALQRARTILDQTGRENVRLVQANINAEPSEALRQLGPFDAAYCRLFLMHQQDPIETLRRMAALLRPGAYIVAHELLLVPPPPSQPEVPELKQVLRWGRDVGLKHGGSPDVARHFHSVCRQAGLREVSQRLFGEVESHDARQRIQSRRQTLLAMRPLLLQHGIASEGEIDAALGHLVEAESWEFEVLIPLLYVELVAQVPPAA